MNIGHIRDRLGRAGPGSASGHVDDVDGGGDGGVDEEVLVAGEGDISDCPAEVPGVDVFHYLELIVDIIDSDSSFILECSDEEITVSGETANVGTAVHTIDYFSRAGRQAVEGGDMGGSAGAVACCTRRDVDFSEEQRLVGA